MKAEEKRQEAWRQVEKSDLTEGNMEGGQLTLKLTERVMTEDGVKYTCHCDWENRRRGGADSRREPGHQDAVGRPVPLSGVARVVPDAEGQVSCAHRRDGALLGHGAHDDEGSHRGASA